MPPQYVSTPGTDLRAAPLGPRGYKSGVKKTGRPGTKRKLEEYAIQVGAIGLHLVGGWTQN